MLEFLCFVSANSSMSRAGFFYFFMAGTEQIYYYDRQAEVNLSI